MHGLFFPGVFFLWPMFLFFGLLKIALFVLVIVFIVRLATHGQRHGACGYDHGHHGHRSQDDDAHDLDPRRVAAWRYAAGKIDGAEFNRIVSGVDAAAAGTPMAPAPPVA